MYYYVALGDDSDATSLTTYVASGGRNVIEMDLNRCELEILPAII
jgi:hypothetical protein